MKEVAQFAEGMVILLEEPGLTIGLRPWWYPQGPSCVVVHYPAYGHVRIAVRETRYAELLFGEKNLQGLRAELEDHGGLGTWSDGYSMIVTPDNTIASREQALEIANFVAGKVLTSTTSQ